MLLKNLCTKWRCLGPGLITGASDDDPSGIATYTQAGASFGLSFLWTSFLTFPLMVVIQEMCARLGFITSQGLSYNIKKYYSKPVFLVVILMNAFAICFNIGADMAMMSNVSHMLLPFISQHVFSFLFSFLTLFGTIYFSYQKMAAVLKWLCLILFVYIFVPFLVINDIKQSFSFSSLFYFEWSYEFLTVFVAILGTTISPYLFFWQASMSVEDKNQKKKAVPHLKLAKKEMQFDINVGMFFSNLIMFFIILTAGVVLFPSGIRNIQTVEQAAQALQPLAGPYAYELFSIGVIGTGFLALPVLAGCLGYMLAEAFEWNRGLDKKFHEAKNFYWVVIAAILSGFIFNFFKFNPIKALIYTAVLYGITAPILIWIILLLCNRKDILGEHVNGIKSNLWGGITFLLMTGAAVSLIYQFIA